MSYFKPCPECGKPIQFYKNPVPTVDIVIFSPAREIVLIERRNYPYGWALPGGFVDYGEQAEAAAIREAREETGLEVVLTGLLGVYSHPDRDPRSHTLSVVYTAQTAQPGLLKPGDDASMARWVSLSHLPELAFDHSLIIQDFKIRLSRCNPGLSL
ncbi:MAG: NUDIX domain-containing protein [Desulfonatronovibrionaceae bacterium]